MGTVSKRIEHRMDADDAGERGQFGSSGLPARDRLDAPARFFQQEVMPMGA